MASLFHRLWRPAYPRLQRLLPAHHGHPLLAGLDRLACVFHGLYENNNYDPASNGEAWLLGRLAALAAGQPWLVVDVGANRGDYTALALQASPRVQVWAFEPVPAVFAQLQTAHAAEPRARLHGLALADQDGPLTLYADPRHSGHTSALAGVQPGVHGLAQPQVFTLPARRLDSFCASQGITAIELLKIDVEGFEQRVLAGAQGLLDAGAIACIQLEYGKANLFSRTFIHDYLRHYGASYRLGKLYPAGVAWYDRYSPDLDDLIGPNLVLVHRRRQDLIEALSPRRRP
ncbi:MAG: FkbM family methyltransferase [Cyanobium sp. M30B3]|nr:MAG: FkbM family methyltransferase [Cyanobium sp. M30B3]